MRTAVANHGCTHLLLHNLCGNAEAMGAVKLARRCAQLKQRGDAFRRTSSLMGEVEGLEALLATTEEALELLEQSDAVRGNQMQSEAALPITAPITASMEHPGAPLPDAPLFVACIDDSEFSREWLRHLLFPALHADAARSGALGETREEQLGFISFALGLLDSRWSAPLSPSESFRALRSPSEPFGALRSPSEPFGVLLILLIPPRRRVFGPLISQTTAAGLHRDGHS